MKRELDSFYERITPESSNREFLDTILRKAEIMERKTNKTVRKPFIAAAAVAAAMAVGTGAAAATGLLDFNEIFGQSIIAEDPEHGSSLLGFAEEQKHVVSNENYIVKLNAVTGTHASLVTSFEISRADGQPINNGNDPHIDLKDISQNNIESFSCGSCHYYLNDNGSIIINWENRLGDDLMISDLNSVAGEIKTSGSISFADHSERVDLDWETSFNYIPTDESLETLTAADLNKKITLNGNKIDEFDVYPVECEIRTIKLTQLGGVIEISAEADEIFFGLNHDNEIFLIKKDGTKILAGFSSGYATGKQDTVIYNVTYYADNKFIDDLAIDLSDISAISINGTIFELS